MPNEDPVRSSGGLGGVFSAEGLKMADVPLNLWVFRVELGGVG